MLHWEGDIVIKLIRIGGETIYINEDFIEWVEATPDTMVKIHDGTTFTVQEEPEAILAMMREWSRSMSGRKEADAP